MGPAIPLPLLRLRIASITSALIPIGAEAMFGVSKAQERELDGFGDEFAVSVATKSLRSRSKDLKTLPCF